MATRLFSGQGQKVKFYDQHNTQTLPIARDYRPLFERLMTSSEVLLARTGLAPDQIGLLKKLRYALGRLPVLTKDLDCCVMLEKTFDLPESQWWLYAFEISDRHVHANQILFSSMSNKDIRTNLITTFHCERGDYRLDIQLDSQFRYDIFERWLHDWENLCSHPEANLMIFKRREFFDWHQPEDPLVWEKMPSLLPSVA